MINHVVLFKLREYEGEKKKQIVEELKSMLESLREKISEIKYLEVGINYELQSNSYDIALVSHFDSVDALNAYRVHPEHLKVVDRVNQTTVSRAAVDYFF